MKISEDKLNRTEFVKSLFKLFDNFVGQTGNGLTMVLNGKYGSGKSTVLNLVEEYNSSHSYKIIKYDAWENNLFDNPLIPILYSISKLEKPGLKIKEKANDIIKNIPKTIIGSFFDKVNIDIKPLLDNVDIFDEYDKYKESIEKFKQVLIEFCSNKKTIILVDELDRCLPEYQIKVLETLFHFQNIPNLVILIAIDREQLEYSIKSKFGDNLNSHGYLSKFIQYEIDLPYGDTYNYIISLMKFKIAMNEDYEAKKAFANVLKSINLPIRECIILIQRLNLLYDNGESHFYNIPLIAGALLILKHTNNSVYKLFFSEKYADLEYKEKEISLSESKFNDFLNIITGTNFEKILNYWIGDYGYGHRLILHFINLFSRVENISLESLSKYLKTTPTDVASILNGYEGFRFPHTLNCLIEKINLII